MINSNVVDGKLLLSNEDNNSKKYGLMSDKYTNYDMYYTYMEAIIPIDKLESYSEDGSTTPLTIAFGKDSDVEVNIYKDNLDAYAVTSEGTKIHYNVLKEGGYTVEEGGYTVEEKFDPANTIATYYSPYNSDLESKDYMVFSIMILPMLNYDNTIEYWGNITNKESNSISFFINGIQIGFNNIDNPGVLFFSRLPFLRIKQFYDNKDKFSKLIKITKIPNKCYIILNTEYERFMYKNLAIMCNNENELKNIEVKDIKKDFLSTTGQEIFLISTTNGFGRQDKCTINSYLQNLHISKDFLNDNSKPIKLYLEFLCSYDRFYDSNDLGGGNPDILSGIGYINNKYKNIFDCLYWYFSSYDNIKFGFDDYEFEDKNFDNYTGEYWDYGIYYNSNNPEIFNFIGNKIDLENLPYYGTTTYDSMFFAYMIAIDPNTNKLHEYALKTRNFDENTYSNYATFEDIGEINLSEGTYIPYLICNSLSILFTYKYINLGESKFHVIPDIFPEGSDGYKQLYRSIENSNWKSLWKYNRTIQFTTFLQDNPVILPLNLIRDNNDNFFLEIITTRNNNSLLEFALGSGIEFYNKNDNAVFKTLTSGIYHCEYIDDSEYQTNSSGTEQINGIKFIKTDSTTGTFGEKVNSYYDKIAFYYNKNTDNENIYVLNIQDGNTVNQLGKVPVSNLLPLKNIMVHLRPNNASSEANVDLGTITINFGYNSDYFQEYIDNLLSYDAYIKLVDLSYYARDNITNYKSITSIPQENLDYLNSGLYASNMTGMFYDCGKLTYIPKLNIDTINVNDMNTMFRYCGSLTSVDLSDFNTSNVTNMSNMFYYCSSLTSLDLSNFNTSKVEDMSNMFYECHSLNSLIISNFNTSKVKTMHNMFTGCFDLTSLDLSNFNTSNVTNMSYMFEGCPGLSSLNVSNFNTSNVTDMNSMFSGCNSLILLDLSNFNTSNVTDMGSMFIYCNSLTSLDLSNFDTSNVTFMGSMFSGCKSLTTIKGIIDMKSCTNYNSMFENCIKLTGVKIKNPPAGFNGAGLSSSQYTIVS